MNTRNSIPSFLIFPVIIIIVGKLINDSFAHLPISSYSRIFLTIEKIQIVLTQPGICDIL